jgi:hypothetical protein
MRARKLILIAVLAVAAIVAARALGLWVSDRLFSPPTNSPPTNPAPTPAIVFAEDDLTFGPIPESEQVERDLRLTNTSSEPITIERFEKSCTCLGIEPAENFTVQPGETTRLRLKLKSSIPAGAKLSADGLVGETVGLLAVTPSVSGVRSERFPTDVRYTVRRTIRFDPPAVQLGVVSHREPLQVKATITLLPPITDVRLLPHPEWDVKVISRGNGRRELTATPTRPGVPRVVNDPINIVPVGTDGEDRPERTLVIRGEVKPDVVSSPADISLGRVAVGSAADESFRLVSLTNRKFRVTGLVADAGVELVADPADATVVSIRLKVSEKGERVATVKASVVQDDGSVLQAELPIRYFGE